MQVGDFRFERDGRTIEVSRRGHGRVAELNRPQPELALCLFEEHTSLDLFGSFINIGKAWRAPREMLERWGAGVHEDYLHLNWGQASKLIRLPFVSWEHDASAHLVWTNSCTWAPAGKAGFYSDEEPDDGRMVYQSPYRYTLRNGVTQEVTATYFVEQRTWRRLWAPFLFKTRFSIEVKFSGEVGEKAGSWKGGCIGCGYEINWPFESPQACLARMEKERRFE